MGKHRLICFAILVLIISCSGDKITPQQESAAVDKAGQWLALLDSGDYNASWREAAEFLQGKVTEQKWVETMTTVRKPMGSLLSRKVKSTHFRTMMPEALKGKYLIIDYKSSFANRKAVVESVTQMMEKDGSWRVAGYHLDEPL